MNRIETCLGLPVGKGFAATLMQEPAYTHIPQYPVIHLYMW